MICQLNDEIHFLFPCATILSMSSETHMYNWARGRGSRKKKQSNMIAGQPRTRSDIAQAAWNQTGAGMHSGKRKPNKYPDRKDRSYRDDA